MKRWHLYLPKWFTKVLEMWGESKSETMDPMVRGKKIKMWDQVLISILRENANIKLYKWRHLISGAFIKKASAWKGTINGATPFLSPSCHHFREQLYASFNYFPPFFFIIYQSFLFFPTSKIITKSCEKDWSIMGL